MARYKGALQRKLDPLNEFPEGVLTEIRWQKQLRWRIQSTDTGTMWSSATIDFWLS